MRITPENVTNKKSSNVKRGKRKIEYKLLKKNWIERMNVTKKKK